MRPSCTQGCQALDTFVGDIKRGANTVQEFLTFQSLFSNMVLGQLDLEPSQHSRQSELNERDNSIPGDTPPPCGGALSGPSTRLTLQGQPSTGTP